MLFRSLLRCVFALVGWFLNVFLGRILFRGSVLFCSVLLSLSYSVQVRGSVSVLEKFDNFFKACSVRSMDHASG